MKMIMAIIIMVLVSFIICDHMEKKAPIDTCIEAVAKEVDGWELF